MVPEVILGVTGSVAAFRAAELAGALRETGYRVTSILTSAATRFVAPLQLEVLSDGGAFADLWTRPMAHVDFSRADAVLVAPATANILGKAASGIADDLLSTVLIAARCPIIFAPAMNWRMYENPAVQQNIRTLSDRGAIIVPPARGRLACGEEGEGRLADREAILFAVQKALSPKILAGMKVVVTSGPTREPLDPVRFLSNRSSGKMGHALAKQAALHGAEVTLISGPVSIPSPPGVTVKTVETTSDMAHAVRDSAAGADVLIMAAAVGDFRPPVSDRKLSREGGVLSLQLETTEDILSSIGEAGPRVRVGFAAEIGPESQRAKEKLRTKGLDFIVFNDVTEAGAGFDVDTNAVTIIHRDGRESRVDLRPKTEIARIIVGEIASLLRGEGEEKKS